MRQGWRSYYITMKIVRINWPYTCPAQRIQWTITCIGVYACGSTSRNAFTPGLAHTQTHVSMNLHPHTHMHACSIHPHTHTHSTNTQVMLQVCNHIQALEFAVLIPDFTLPMCEIWNEHRKFQPCFWSVPSIVRNVIMDLTWCNIYIY